jgi:alkylhydroperoxidase family enzyme
MGTAPDRHRRAVERLRRAVLVGSDPVEGPLGSFAAKVRDDANRVTDGDVAGLVADGFSEDRILEVTLAAAVSAATARLAAGLTAMQSDDPRAEDD